MREVKFRGLRTDGTGWVYGFYAFEPFRDKGAVILEDTDMVHDCQNALCEVEVIPETVGQYTGRKVEDREIYVGDGGNEKGLGLGRYIVKLGTHGTHQGFYVEWLDGYAKDSYRRDLGYWIDYGLLFDMNIHQNPELITDETNTTKDCNDGTTSSSISD